MVKFYTLTTILWVILATFMALCFAGSVSAVDCNTTASIVNTTTITDNCLFSSSGTYVFASGNYIFNGTGGRVIRVTSNNTILDGNGSIFIGNWTTTDGNSNLATILISNNNVTIKNFIFTNYYQDIWIDTPFNNSLILNNTFNYSRWAVRLISNSYNSKILNNSFLNQTYAGFFSNGNNFYTNISYNYFINQSRRAVSLESSGYETGDLISYNNITEYRGGGSSIYFHSGANNTISNNYMEGGNKLNDIFMRTHITNNTLIFNNTIKYTQYSIQVETISLNTNVSSNYIIYNDIGGLIGGLNTLYENNIVDIPTNTTIDGYNVPIKMIECNNCSIRNNIFRNITQGLLIQNTTNLNISSNSFSFLAIVKRPLYSINNYNDPPCAIKLVELYEGFIGGGLEINPSDNITYIGQFKSVNISISNNSFDSNTNCFLQTEGTQNVIHDLTNYWTTQFQTPTYLKDSDIFYISNNYNNLSAWNLTANSPTLQSKYYNVKTEYNIFNSYLYFLNKNTTSLVTQLYNKSNALFTNGTSLCTGSSANIGDNDGNVNITLQPSENCTVLDEFNFTESWSGTYLSENFDSYSIGNDTMRPTWVPQYYGLVNITPYNTMQVNAYRPFQGDRDIHVSINSSSVPNIIRNVTFSFSYNITDCNQTWKGDENVTQQGATGYLFYNNTPGNDFLDAEFKMFSNNTSCTNGTAQLSSFKRVNGVSTALIPFTQFAQQMNKTLNVVMRFESYNSTNYNYTISLNGTVLASTLGVGINDIKAGPLLLESAGTITEFSNVSVKYDNLFGINRPFNPLSFINPSNQTKYFNSSLLSKIANVTTSVFVDNCSISSIRYTPVGESTRTISSFTCSNGIATFNLDTINPSTSFSECTPAPGDDWFISTQNCIFSQSMSNSNNTLILQNRFNLTISGNSNIIVGRLIINNGSHIIINNGSRLIING